MIPDVASLQAAIDSMRIELDELRKERDEARRKYSDLFAFTTGRAMADVAQSLGWDCYKEDGK